MVLFAFIILLKSGEIFFDPAYPEPCPRNQPVIAWHSEMQVVILFGGYCSQLKTRLNDLWKYDGSEWIQIQSKNPPPPRSGHAMLYDPAKQRLLVFGGKNNQGELLNDLWAWNGVDWELISDSGPPPRQSHRMIFNPDNGFLLLFGGSDQQGKSYNDTWLFQSTQWVQAASEESPPPRLQHTMAYDQQRKKVVLFGGFDRSESGKVVFGDTWEWDAENGWECKNKSEQMARDHHAMAYDAHSKQIILFGGYNQGYLGDTRSWDGKNWTLLTNNGPSERAGKPGLVYSDSLNGLILFGCGNSDNLYLQDLWIFDGASERWRVYDYQ